MEGGRWGLVIIFAAFMIQVLTFGTTAAVGVYNMELLDYFGEEATVQVSLIGAINYGIFLGSGPIVSFLMTKFTYRQITLFGSLLTVIGLLGMPILPYIPSLCICFGLLTGFGSCCCYVPSHVLSGLYFEKYRSLATGVTTSGSGLGGAIMPVIAGLLIDMYSWKGSLIVVAGLCLNLFVFSSLLREPPPFVLEEIVEEPSVQSNQLISSTQAVSISPTYVESDSSVLGLGLNRKDYVNNDDGTTVDAKPLVVNNEPREIDAEIKKNAQNDANNSYDFKKPLLDRLTNHHSISLNSLSAVGATRGSSLLVLDKSNHSKMSTQETKSESPPLKPPKSSRHIFIFTHSGFNIYFLSNIMWNAGFSIVNSFAPEFLRERGMSTIVAAYLVGGCGFGCFLGGIFGGVFGNFKFVNRQAFYIVSNLLCGLTLIIFPFYDDIVFYALCLIGNGLFFGVILGLLIILLTDLIGVESLENGLGYLMLSNGVGTFIGPPLAGLIKDNTGDFDGGMIFAGVLFLFGAFIMLLMPCKQVFTKCSTK
ncbi:monocarboxylate transporter 9 [Biomphalaria glabrata]|uniref:Major facilitator superfamily (MFS) profile domain-containing protein n=1 Tax=Biomphalaria glabrata TaxID=6526 RepID=A0A2C9KK39_BIOGL|nr:monocarboxylate transporter 9 [Biomphalaria glabrata]